MADEERLLFQKLDASKKLPTRSVRYALDYRRCGRKECTKCPHGPYWYKHWYEGGKMRCKYIGKKLPREATEEERAKAMGELLVYQRSGKKGRKASGSKKGAGEE